MLWLNNEFADCPHVLMVIIGQDQLGYYSGYITVLLNGRVASVFHGTGSPVPFVVFNVEGIFFITLLFQLHYVM